MNLQHTREGNIDDQNRHIAYGFDSSKRREGHEVIGLESTKLRVKFEVSPCEIGIVADGKGRFLP